ncbi:MAG TPA: ATP synthase F1 subunit epsilon [Aquificaceae bacterium]|nr:ATP synthase F1 subunit epsilon [Aquificaceae bacterium]HIQ48547.1 ATP synthase F1 subunit epsilon [Aquifex aeolicus]
MIQVEIVSPQGLLYAGEVESVNVPTVEGEVGILENHMFLMTLLKPGLVYFNGDDKNGVVVTYGILDVTPKKVLILTEEGYELGKLPPESKLREEFEKAIKKQATAETMEEIKEWEKATEKVRALLDLVERYR